MSNQNSLEWFWLNLTDDLIGGLSPEKISKIYQLKEQAKAMHKEEIKEAIMFGDCRGEVSTYKILEQYYNETFGGK